MYHSYPVQKENYSIIACLHVIEGDPPYPEFALNIKLQIKCIVSLCRQETSNGSLR